MSDVKKCSNKLLAGRPFDEQPDTLTSLPLRKRGGADLEELANSPSSSEHHLSTVRVISPCCSGDNVG